MKIDCLMGTYGRYSTACEALSCFLQQSRSDQAGLLIYNQHPIPLSFEHPKVRVVNEVPPEGSLRFIRSRMIELADASADFIHFWDDDDLYLPWHLEDCLRHVGDSIAWKPRTSWISKRNVEFSLKRNRFEGSWLFRSEYLRSAPLDTHPDYTDHPIYLQAVEAGLLTRTELGGRTSYIYRWDTETKHLSGFGSGDENTQRRNLDAWRCGSDDVRRDGRLVPADMTMRWRQYLAGIKDKVTPEDWEQNRLALRLCSPLEPHGLT